MPGAKYKIPISVLVVIHTLDLQVLLLERADWPGFWQSVTGSLARQDEPLADTAAREVREETGIAAYEHRLEDWDMRNRFEIFHKRRSLFLPGTTHNIEHVFGLTVAEPVAVTLEPREHLRYVWLPWREAAAKTPSWSNRDAILLLPEKAAGPAPALSGARPASALAPP